MRANAIQTLPVLTVRSLWIAGLSGCLMGLTTAPVNGWGLAWVAQVPLWILAIKCAGSVTGEHQGIPPSGIGRSPSWRAALVFGLLWGLGYYGTTLIWITGLHPLTWMGIPWGASVAIAFTCWLIVTLWGCVWSGTWAVGLVWCTQRIQHTQTKSWPQTAKGGLDSSPWTVGPALRRILFGTALWCGLDTLWSQGILYWPTLALTQSPHNLWLLQLNQLSGPTTTTALVALVNGTLAEAWMTYRDRHHHPRSSSGAQVMFAVAVATLLMAHGAGAWMFSQASLFSPPGANGVSSSALSLGLIQGNIPTRVKLTGNGIRQAFDRYTHGYRTLVEAGVDGVIMPEGALPVVWDQARMAQHPVARAVRDHHVPALIGTFVPVPAESPDEAPQTITQSLLVLTTHPVAKDTPSPPLPRNTSTALAPLPHKTERVVDTGDQYNKVRLVPLGEYIPADGILGAVITRLSPIQSSMVPGTSRQILETPWGQAIAGICYESAFPELFRRQTAAGGEFLITASNNDPYNGAMMAQHHAQDVMRAIESDRWTVRVTNTGYSGVVSPRGETLWRSQRNQYVTHIAHIRRRQTQTPYVRWGNWLTPVLLVAAITVLLVDTVKGNR